MSPQPRTDTVHLRAFTEADLDVLDRLCTDPEALGAFEWPGFSDPRSRRKRWEADGYISAESAAVAIARADDTVAGIASWLPRGSPSGVAYEIGAALLPEHRGQGLGAAAQQLLVDYLLDHTTANRLEALTNAGNIAEQKTLTRLGFRHEGTMRGRSFQHGEYVDVLVYGLLRSDRRG
ncbi:MULTISPECIES: GNAT family N-acetyltransferase [unclassified Streptomyces]|uniref:GNAT family N-acetyltransferase n=1 Tax=unclassified Streptomyces TaxID=2593676 RepID=UPI00278BE319|nr:MULTISPECIES: GNAT family protein [unclassified Streptomyces]